jgi:hypothetical protein
MPGLTPPRHIPTLPKKDTAEIAAERTGEHKTKRHPLRIAADHRPIAARAAIAITVPMHWRRLGTPRKNIQRGGW